VAAQLLDLLGDAAFEAVGPLAERRCARARIARHCALRRAFVRAFVCADLLHV
jgi:hypothetical protein